MRSDLSLSTRIAVIVLISLAVLTCGVTFTVLLDGVGDKGSVAPANLERKTAQRPSPQETPGPDESATARP